jgi:uncharacterized membrane protein YbhN (UPF0104 family)
MTDADNIVAPEAPVLATSLRRGARLGHSARRWRSSRRRVAIVAVALAGIGLAVGVLAHSRTELVVAITTLARVCPGWVVAAVLAEAVCYLTRGAATGIVLRSGTSTANQASETTRRIGPDRVSAPVLGAMTMAGDAVAYCLPLGFAAGGVVAVEQLHRRRVPTIVASWAFTVTTLLYVAVLGALGIVAVALAGATGAANPFPGLQAAALIALALFLVILALIAALRRARPGGQIAQLLDSGRRSRAHLSTAAHRRVCSPDDRRADRYGWIRLRRHLVVASATGEHWWAQLHLLRLSPGAVTTAAGAMLISWLADIAVLAVAFLALGMHPPWLGLLLAYCAGQLASSLPITPGGLGVAEGTLAVALVAFGGCTTGTLAAVLLYRLISHWAIIPAGALAWLIVARPPHPRRSP